VKYIVSHYKNIETDNYITFCFEDRCLSNEHKKIFDSLKDNNLFCGKDREVYCINSFENDCVKHVIFIGLGNQEALTNEKTRLAVAEGVKIAQRQKFKDYNFLIDSDDIKYVGDINAFVENIVKSILMTLYTYNAYTSRKNDVSVKNIKIISQLDKAILYKAILQGEALAGGVNLARDLINDPPNYLTPTSFGEKAIEISDEYGFDVNVYDTEWLKENRFNCLIEVGKASENTSKLIEMKYTGNPENKSYTAVVGKGVTFDSGGYNLKKSEGLEYMKSDMGGAAAVLGLMKAVSQTKQKVNIIALIPTCENMIDGKSYRAGDVILSREGKYIEIGNTDAEGRLILADAMSYASDMEDVELIVDIATLTGNSAVALGSVCAATFSNDDELYKCLYAASKETNEKIWRLPLYDEYKSYLMSTVADMKNTSSRKGAGAIVAGTFLSNFVKSKPWIHIDMASTNASIMAMGYNPRGAKGFGVRLLFSFIKLISKDKSE